MSTQLEALPVWFALPFVFFLLLGSLVILVGALGLFKLANFYQRIHGPAITISLGTGAILMASMIYFTATQSRLVIHELLITLFLFMTAPVVSMMIMRAAVYRDLRKSRHLTIVDKDHPSESFIQQQKPDIQE